MRDQSGLEARHKHHKPWQGCSACIHCRPHVLHVAPAARHMGAARPVVQRSMPLWCNTRTQVCLAATHLLHLHQVTQLRALQCLHATAHHTLSPHTYRYPDMAAPPLPAETVHSICCCDIITHQVIIHAGSSRTASRPFSLKFGRADAALQGSLPLRACLPGQHRAASLP